MAHRCEFNAGWILALQRNISVDFNTCPLFGQTALKKPKQLFQNCFFIYTECICEVFARGYQKIHTADYLGQQNFYLVPKAAITVSEEKSGH